LIIEFNGKELLDETLKEIRNWSYYYQGGNMWGQYDSYLTAMRDVIGLELPEHKKYKYWEESAIHGGFRFMHDKFCLVSDFPEFIRKNNENQPHSEYGPSHRWMDGWELYHLHGIRFEKAMWEKIVKQTMTFGEIMAMENVDQRTVALKYCKPSELFKSTKSIKLDGITKRGNTLWKMPKEAGIFDRDEYFLHYDCASKTGKEYIKCVTTNYPKFGNDADSLMASYRNMTLEQYYSPTFISA